MLLKLTYRNIPQQSWRGQPLEYRVTIYNTQHVALVEETVTLLNVSQFYDSEEQDCLIHPDHVKWKLTPDGRQTDRLTDRQTDGRTDGQTDRQTNRQTLKCG